MNPSNPKAKNLNISGETDVAYAALEAKNFAREIGFSKAGQYMISIAVSELVRNILVYAKIGTISLKFIDEYSKKGIEVVAVDLGPGIQDIDKAMEDNYSTGGTMGVGLPGTKRLMDYFKIDTHRTQGTKIVIRKWI